MGATHDTPPPAASAQPLAQPQGQAQAQAQPHPEQYQPLQSGGQPEKADLQNPQHHSLYNQPPPGGYYPPQPQPGFPAQGYPVQPRPGIHIHGSIGYGAPQHLSMCHRCQPGTQLTQVKQAGVLSWLMAAGLCFVGCCCFAWVPLVTDFSKDTVYVCPACHAEVYREKGINL